MALVHGTEISLPPLKVKIPDTLLNYECIIITMVALMIKCDLNDIKLQWGR
jgi:hypothetical protein